MSALHHFRVAVGRLFSARVIKALLPGLLLVACTAQAQIIADPNAPGRQRPTILAAPNGRPLVNIQTPSPAGVSRNTYSQFDIDGNGAILNNSRNPTQTQLGGWVNGNPWLATGPARIILNEVNSNDPSRLFGPVEVAGPRAQVVVANPSGITCNGCGFINASRVTLTTGRPVFGAQGSLDAWRVTGGTVSIDGRGMNASDANTADILARHVQINADLWAQYANVVAGAAQTQVDANGAIGTSTPLASTEKRPDYLVDVAAVGGMYANHIFMRGTEAGLGAVRNDGNLIASGDIAITADGQLVSRKLLHADGKLQIQTESVENSGQISAGQVLRVDTRILANQTSGEILGSSVDINATRVQNVGLINGGDVSLAGSEITNTGKGRIYGDSIAIQADDLRNEGDAVAGTAPVIAASQRIDLGVTRLRNSDGALIYSDGDLAIGGAIETQTDPTTGKTVRRAKGMASEVNNDSANIEALGNGRISSVVFNNRNIHLQIGQQQEASFYEETVETVTRDGTTLSFKASICLDLRGDEAARCMAHPELYGLRWPLLPVRAEETTCGGGEGACTGTTVENYAWNDPVFQRFNVASVGPPPPEPVYGGYCLEVADPACDAWRTQYSSWNRGYQAALDRLAIPLNAYNELVNEDNRLVRFEDYTLYRMTGYPTRSVVQKTVPSILRVGGNLTITGDGPAKSSVTNQDSHIVAGGVTTVTGTSLNNVSTPGTYRVDYTGTWEYTTVESCGIAGQSHCREWHGQHPYNPAPSITTIALPTVAPLPASSGGASPVRSGTVAPISGNALFKLTPERNYLIETDPAFTRYRNWLSSDYQLQALQRDPNLTQKRLGDGFYEQKLVRDQVAQLTGRRFLDGYTDDEAQYLALMQSGVTFAKAQQLTPGVKLSAAQVAQLTSDIVWLEEQEVSVPGPDGKPVTSKVLVPHLYVRAQPGDLDGSGGLLSGDSVQADLSGDLANSGTIAGRKLVKLSADNINNAGTIRGADVDLQASRDIRIEGGQVQADNSLQAQAGRDLLVNTTTIDSQTALSPAEQATGSRYTRTGIDRVASLYVTGKDSDQSGGSNGRNAGKEDSRLLLSAGRDVSLSGAQVRNEGPGATVVVAGRDLKLGSVTAVEDNRSTPEKDNTSQSLQQKEIGSTLSSQGRIALSAGQDLSLRASSVASETDAIQLQAGRDIAITSGQDRQVKDDGRHYSSSGTLSSSTTTLRDRFDSTSTVASTVSGKSVTAEAGRNLSVQGSTVIADDDLRLKAGGDIKLQAATETASESHYKKEEKSGVMASGGFGVTVGSRKQTVDGQFDSTRAAPTVVGSVKGNVNISAGQTYQQTGSDVLAPGGDVTIQARKVEIAEARETTRSTVDSKFEQTGVTVAVSNPVITAVQTADQMQQAAGNTSDPRMKALAAANTALVADRAIGAMKAGQGDVNGKLPTGKAGPDGNPEMRDATLADKLGGVDVSVSFGKASSQSSSVSTTDSARGSTIAAGRNVSISASGAGEESSLLLQGSQVAAGNQASLSAEGKLQLQAAHNSASLSSSNSSSSGSVGMSVGTSGTLATASASRAKGNADGNDSSWTQTRVEAGTQVNLQSGTDTTLRGATVVAPRVEADVGRNLQIESLQDTSTYHSDQKSIGGSVSVGPGKISGNVSYNTGKIDSDYASVAEQSGIKAGDGGFDVKVGKDAVLKGAAITSTQKAVEEDRNRYEAKGSTTLTDVSNKASYSANSVGVNVGTGFDPAGKLAPTGTGVGLGSDGDSKQSETRAAISGIAGNKDARTGDKDAALPRIFDAEKVQKEVNAQVQITQTFSREASAAVGRYAADQLTQAQSKQRQAQQKQAQAEAARAQGDTERAAALTQEAKALQQSADTLRELWGEQGKARVAMHAVVGGLTGGIEGAVGAGGATIAAPLIDAQINKLDLPDGVKQTVLAASTTALGAALGGTAGAGAALTETANNYLTSKQEVERDKELAACKTLACTAGTNLKYSIKSAQQDAGLVVGVGGGIGVQSVEQALAIVDMVANLPETLTALKAIVTDPQVREKVGEAVVADYQQRIDTLTRAYNDGGFDGSVTAGVEAGRLAVDIVGLGTAAAGATKVVVITARAGAGLVAGDVASVAAGAARSGNVAEREATGFLGRSGNELKNAPYQALRNEATQINGRDYSGHALDQMQNRGLMPSVVENALRTGTQFPTRAGTTGVYDAVNNLRVIVNSETGRVITVIRGAP